MNDERLDFHEAGRSRLRTIVERVDREISALPPPACLAASWGELVDHLDAALGVDRGAAGVPETPFRALFLVRDGLDHVEVVALGDIRGPSDDPPANVLSGRSDLLAFIRHVGLDSVVESYQVSDAPKVGFLYAFHVASSPEAMVDLLSERLKPAIRATHRVRALSCEKAPEQLTLSPHEAFQLGASRVSAADGIARVRDWSKAREPVAAQPASAARSRFASS
jgi:hypothetical protein